MFPRPTMTRSCLAQATVNGTSMSSAGGVLPGRGGLAEASQVVIPRNPQQMKLNKLSIGEWNVRTLFQAGKLKNVQVEAKRLGIDILGISETRWPGTGQTTIDDEHTFIYSGGSDHNRGVGIMFNRKIQGSFLGFWPISDRVVLAKFAAKPFNLAVVQAYAPTGDSSQEELETFYKQINLALQEVKPQEYLVILGDFNAKIGKGKDGTSVGPFGLGERNERGDRLVEFAEEEKLVVTNTWFKHRDRNLYTWTSPQDGEKVVRNQIDFILVKQRFKRSLKNVKTYPGADCSSDHALIVAKISLKLKILKKSNPIVRWRLDYLNGEVAEKYTVKTENKFDILMTEEPIKDIEESWQAVKEIVQTEANEVLKGMTGQSVQTKKKSWMSEQILDLIAERRKAKRGSEEYKKLNRLIKKECRNAKLKYIELQCNEIEACEKTHNSRELHRRIKQLAGKKGMTASGVIQDRTGNNILFEKDKVKDRWAEYVEDLYDDNSRMEIDEPRPIQNENRLPILESELNNAIGKMKKNKACGEDNLPAEFFQLLGEKGIKYVLGLCNNIYESGQMPEDFLSSIFITIPKKNGAVNCKDHRTISLINHACKILLNIVHGRIKNKIDAYISDEQNGFRKGRGTRESIFNLRIMSERAIQMQKDVYVCFIDFEKAFDRVYHKKMINILEKVGIDDADIRIIENLYWQQTAVVKINGEYTRRFKVRRGVRQGCILSPILYNIYSEFMMQDVLSPEIGVKINGQTISSIRYADDTALIAENEQDLQEVMSKLQFLGDEYGLKINKTKTKVMVISKFTPMRAPK